MRSECSRHGGPGARPRTLVPRTTTCEPSSVSRGGSRSTAGATAGRSLPRFGTDGIIGVCMRNRSSQSASRLFASALLVLLIVLERLPFASAASDDETARWWQHVEAL